MIRNILTATLLALLALLGSAMTAGAEEPNQDDVIAVDFELVSAAMWSDLRELGYTGIPTDAAERLYVPRDVAVSTCRTDADCEAASSAPATWYERDNVEERAALGGCERIGLVTNEDLSCTRP